MFELVDQREWWAYVGGADEYLRPVVCESRKVAEAEAVIRNVRMPSLGPWHAIPLYEHTQRELNARAA